MDTLHGMRAFARTAELGSFVAAGRALALSASAVGKAVARLEAELGVRLLQRSTRRLQLSAEGQDFLAHCRLILDEWDEAQARLRQARAEPRGRLRISAPRVAHHWLVPLLPAFVARCPAVELDLLFTDRRVDLLEEEVDLAIRSGPPGDSRLVSRELGAFRLLLCAAPGYLRRHGQPTSAQALGEHAAVRFRHPDSGKLLDWPWRAGLDAPVHPRTVLACNQMDAVLGAVLRELGLACMPDFLVHDALAQGRLVELLPGVFDAPGQFRAYWPSRRQLSPRVRAWLDHLGQALGQPAPRSSSVAGGQAR